MANSCNHFRALLKKNWILFKRSPCGSCCEIVTPIVFVLFLLAVRGLVSKDAVAETSYYGPNKGAYFTKNLNISNQTYSLYNSSNATTQTKLLEALFTQTHLKFFFSESSFFKNKSKELLQNAERGCSRLKSSKRIN